MQSTHTSHGKSVLSVALELSKKAWKLALSEEGRERPATATATAQNPRERLEQVVQRAAETRKRWRLPANCQVVAIYEAGQDAFWIKEALEAEGWRVLVVDAASIPVSRHTKRAKTDRLDALKLLETLMNWLQGKRHEVRMVHAPSAQTQALRQLTRDRGQLQKEMDQHRDRIRKLLRTVGCWQELDGDVGQRLADGEFRTWDGQALPQLLRERLLREWERLLLARAQLRALERSLLQQLPEPVRQSIAALARLKGIGWIGAIRLVLELYWRNFHNRRQVGACLGLVPQPHDSGDSRVDQGISKASNRRVRSLLIELAWLWLRYQPRSALAKWFGKRTAASASNKRAKRIAIVAVARRLAIGLWRYLTQGVIPPGAQFKTA